MWVNQFEAFPEFDLYFVDVRRQGESHMKKGLPDFQGALDDISLILDHFKIDRATLVGHSWGGNPLQEFTLLHPQRVRGFSFTGSWGQHRQMPRLERLSLKLTSRIYAVIPWKWMARYAANACSKDPETRELIRQEILRSGRETFLNLGISSYSQVHPIDGYPGNPPMLFIRGEDDSPQALKKIYSYLVSKNPNARQVIIPNTVQQPMNDAPDEFNRFLGEFLAEVDTNNR